jgi:hypothetical protein
MERVDGVVIGANIVVGAAVGARKCLCWTDNARPIHPYSGHNS